MESKQGAVSWIRLSKQALWNEFCLHKCKTLCPSVSSSWWVSRGKQQNYLCNPFCKRTVHPCVSPPDVCTLLFSFNFLYLRLQVYLNAFLHIRALLCYLSIESHTDVYVYIHTHTQILSPWDNSVPWLREQTCEIRAETWSLRNTPHTQLQRNYSSHPCWPSALNFPSGTGVPVCVDVTPVF